MQPKKEFNEFIWKENISERHKMIEDLLSSNYLIGKSKSKVNEVFGRPKNDLKNEIWQYELIGHTWSDFILYDLKLYFEDHTVVKFDYSIRE